MVTRSGSVGNVYRAHRREQSGDSRQRDWINLNKHETGSVNSSDTEDAPFNPDLDDVRDEFESESDLSETHDCAIEGCRRVVINISGLKFETQERTLNRLPQTLLGDSIKRKEYWHEREQEYFFDRHRPSFGAILYFYQSGGRLERPFEVPPDVFLNELKFFELGKTALASYQLDEGFIIEEPPLLPKRHLQRLIWELFEYPDTSIAARVLAIVSVVFILTSITTFCVETLPQFKGSECRNVTSLGDNGTEVFEGTYPNYGHPLFIIETVCITWFVFELIMRILFCPSKNKFFKDIINWIDFASIMPFFLQIAMFAITRECGSGTGAVLSVLRVLRVTRIFKLSKHSEGLQLLGRTLQTSFSELLMFVLFLGIGVVICSGAIFYAELNVVGSHFHSIPGSFWWAIVSMTTVGYGDMYPHSMLGKLIGTVTVVLGILSIALPVPVIVTNFNNFYRHAKTAKAG